jgi:hypothetical protein
VKRIALVAVAVTALASTWTATAAPEDNSTQQPTHHAVPSSCTAKAFHAFSAKVWNPAYWRRAAPRPAAIEAQRRRLACAGPANRAAMKRTWQRDKAAFYEHRREKLDDLHYLEAIDPPGPSVLAAIRACESGGDYSINSGNGFYGAYQFTLGAWGEVGGTGLPSDAPPREQDERAAALYRIHGSGPWPVCGV